MNGLNRVWSIGHPLDNQPIIADMIKVGSYILGLAIPGYSVFNLGCPRMG